VSVVSHTTHTLGPWNGGGPKSHDEHHGAGARSGEIEGATTVTTLGLGNSNDVDDDDVESSVGASTFASGVS
jgi:hypothetical protein